LRTGASVSWSIMWVASLGRGLAPPGWPRRLAVGAGTIGPGLGFCLGLESLERVGPELVEEVAERAKALCVDGVHPLRAVGPVGHEAGVFQDAEMLGNGGPAHRKCAGQLADRLGPAAQPPEDRTARAVAQRIELRMIVSNH
jgi:hypothetical protein